MENIVADVVVIGYGGAGAAAAIAAHDAGAKVIILEKTPEGGGNTKLSGGTIREFLDVGNAVTYLEAITYGTVDRDVIRAFVEETMEIPNWIKELGADIGRANMRAFPPAPHVVFPHLPGAEGVGGRWKVGKGDHLWNLLRQNVEDRKIEIHYNTSGKQLKTNEDGEVVGLVAESPNGEIMVKAKRGVILTCGGFQGNQEMQAQYIGFRFSATGASANSGDGITMAQELGADLWHMNGVSCIVGYKVPGIEPAFIQRMLSAGYIYVDQNGNRFLDETGTDAHAMHFSFCHLDFHSLSYPRSPSYTIFDENTRAYAPIAHNSGWTSNYHLWSKDNLTEIEKGWIKTALSVPDLAQQIGVSEKALEETLTKYNASCVTGHDADFNRLPTTLKPIEKPPFYAIATWPSLLNTQGGPKRNAKAQVLDVRGKPIKRLYSAGELGSMFGTFYPGAGNVSECVAFGRIAGSNAAKENSI